MSIRHPTSTRHGLWVGAPQLATPARGRGRPIEGSRVGQRGQVSSISAAAGASALVLVCATCVVMQHSVLGSSWWEAAIPLATRMVVAVLVAACLCGVLLRRADKDSAAANRSDGGNRDRPRDEAGAVFSVWTVFALAGVFVLMLGLVYDGGNVIDERIEAKRVASQAARAGADALSQPSVLNGEEAIDPAAAAARGHEIIARAGWSGTVTVTGDQVHATVTGHSPNQFLGAVGIGSFAVHEEGSAVAIRGPTG